MALVWTILVSLMGWASDVVLNSPESVPMGAPFEVRYQGGEEKGALITVAKADGSRLTGAAYGYVSAKRLVKLTAPAIAGDYSVVYKKGNEVLASVPLKVTPVSASLKTKGEVAIRESMEVQWTGPEYPKSILQVFAADGKKVPGIYAYVANAKGKPIQLVAPEKPGQYQVRFLIGKVVLATTDFVVQGSEASLAVAATGTAGSDIEIEWKGPDNKGDYLAFAKPGATRRITGLGYTYTANSSGNRVTLVLPEETGAIEVVYITGRTVLARAPVVVKPVSASLEARDTVIGNLHFEVKWQGPGNRGDRVVMIKPGDEKLRSAYAYLDPLVDRINLKAPGHEGTWRLEYRSKKNKILASRDIRVEAPAQEPATLRVTQAAAARLGPNDGLEVVLDASGSMLKRQNGARRIETAKKVLEELVLQTIPAEVGFAMRVFGHKEANSCRTDLEIPLGPLNPAKVASKIKSIQAINLSKTPLGASLSMVGEDLANVRGERLVLLLTDGAETCDGDAAGAIKALRAKGWDIRVHIVGYAIEDVELEQTFESWAALGGGRYFQAQDSQQLSAAFLAAVATAFEIFDNEGRLVSVGVTNGDGIQLPAGKYKVQYKRNGQEKKLDVSLSAGQSFTLDLK